MSQSPAFFPGDTVRTTTGVPGTVHAVDGFVVWVDTAHGRFGIEADQIERN